MEECELAAVPFYLAQIMKGALEAEGVSARLHPPIRSPDGFDPIVTRLYVPAEDLERARLVLASLESEHESAQAEPPEAEG